MDQQDLFPDIAERLNEVRIARALALLSPLQKHLFHLIPFLIHQNSVQYPGYHHPNTPSGISGYKEEKMRHWHVMYLSFPLYLKRWIPMLLKVFMQWAALQALAKMLRVMLMFG